MAANVVKTGEPFLRTVEDGDAGYAPANEDVTGFLSYEEAESTANGHLRLGTGTPAVSGYASCPPARAASERWTAGS